jgi:hypothetical protein
MVGQTSTNYEPNVIVEGVIKGERYEDGIILQQIKAVRNCLNMIIFNKYRLPFYQAVMVMDMLLILKGKSKNYTDKKAALMVTYKLKEEKLDVGSLEEPELNNLVQFGIDLFKEQLTLIYNTMEKDIHGELDIDEAMLIEQQGLEIEEGNEDVKKTI